jgi:alpha-tubulin suppressor-like RCC1 family protein
MDGVMEVAVGRYHSLALRGDGSLWAWGDNYLGQLGIGVEGGKEDRTVFYEGTDRDKPTLVMEGVAAIAASGVHSLAIKEDGSLWAWGNNTTGELGDSTRTTRYAPVKVMDGVAAVAAGEYHSLALRWDGGLWAWGDNSCGQLGDGDTRTRHAPVRIMDGVTAVAAGGYHSLALREDGGLWAWGYNSDGQLGDAVYNGELGDCDKGADLDRPVKILDGVTAIAAGYNHSLAIKEDGSLWAWGGNWSGQLGDGGGNNRDLPLKVMDGVVAVAAGHSYSLAIKEDGSLWVWGYDNYWQLRDGAYGGDEDDFDEGIDKYKPVMVVEDILPPAPRTDLPESYPDLPAMGVPAAPTSLALSLPTQRVALAAGGYHSLAVKGDGGLWAWGDNYYGQLGIGTHGGDDKGFDEGIDQDRPVWVMDGVTAVAAGYHSLALREDGGLWAWGRNYYGGLGDGTSDDSAFPSLVMDGVVAVAAGSYHSLALRGDGGLWAWGGNGNGQLGDGAKGELYSPELVLDGVVAVAAGGVHSLAIRWDGSLWAWGHGYYGQLGDGGDDTRFTAIKVMDDVVAVAAGYYHSLALRGDGSLWAWGRNSEGQLGDGTRETRRAPVRVMDNVTAMAAGVDHSLAIRDDGSLWAWGDNYYAQLYESAKGRGLGVFEEGVDQDRPGWVMDDVTEVAAGEFFSLALRGDGSLWAWGDNHCGQLGVGAYGGEHEAFDEGIDQDRPARVW